MLVENFKVRARVTRNYFQRDSSMNIDPYLSVVNRRHFAIEKFLKKFLTYVKNKRFSPVLSSFSSCYKKEKFH